MLAYVSLKIYIFYVKYGVSSNYVLVKKEEIKKRKQKEKKYMSLCFFVRFRFLTRSLG